MNYQRRDLVANEDIGEPGPLPAELEGLTDDALANLSAALSAGACTELGYTGQGFVPVPDPVIPPPAVRTVSQIEFLQRIPAAKRIAIRGASATDPVIADFLGLVGASIHGIELDNADTQAAMAYLQSQSLLTADDVAAILA